MVNKILFVAISLIVFFIFGAISVYAASPIGYLDAANDQYIAGWAHDPDYSGPINVKIYVDGELVKTELANRYRDGLIGVCGGEGNCSYHWNHQGFGNGSHKVEVFAVDVNQYGQPTGQEIELTNSPKRFVAGDRFFGYSPHTSWPEDKGIPIATMWIDTRQYRQFVRHGNGTDGNHINALMYWSPRTITAAKSSLPNWPHSRLIDGSHYTAWSSAYHPGSNYIEWFAWFFGVFNHTNYIMLVPRFYQGQNRCVPELVHIYYGGVNAQWNYIKSAYLDEDISKDGYYISFDEVYANGILVITDRLRDDGEGGYYFQMAEVYAGVSEYEFDDSYSDVLDFAEDNPGMLYTVGDEPDQNSVFGATPHAYAEIYQKVVQDISAVDPTAKFSPTGFAQPNPILGPHFTDYAQQFYDAYVDEYGTAPPVDEWRFHAFSGYPQYEPNLIGWKNLVTQATDWSIEHGAPMFLGSFGFPGVDESYDVTSAEYEVMEYVYNDTRIAGAAWWSYDWGTTWPHTLLNLTTGELTEEGIVYRDFIVGH